MDAWSLASHVDRHPPHRAAARRAGAVDVTAMMRAGTALSPADWARHIGTVAAEEERQLPDWLDQLMEGDVAQSTAPAPDLIQTAWNAASGGTVDCAAPRQPELIATPIYNNVEAVSPPPPTPVQDEAVDVMPTAEDRADPLYQGQAEVREEGQGDLSAIRLLLTQAVGHIAAIADRCAAILEETHRVERSVRSMCKDFREDRRHRKN